MIKPNTQQTPLLQKIREEEFYCPHNIITICGNMKQIFNQKTVNINC